MPDRLAGDTLAAGDLLTQYGDGTAAVAPSEESTVSSLTLKTRAVRSPRFWNR
jgi:hypothetical protein